MKDEYMKLQKTTTHWGFSLNQHTLDCDCFTTVYCTCTRMVQLHWWHLQGRLQLVPTQQLLCKYRMFLKMQLQKHHPACCVLMML